MLYIKGNVIWKKQREVEFTNKEKKKESFTEHTYMICENGEDPQTIKSTKKIQRKVGDKVEIPIMIKTWETKSGEKVIDLMEVNGAPEEKEPNKQKTVNV